MVETKYQIGDKVRVIDKDEMSQGRRYRMENDRRNHDGMTKSMTKLANQIVTIGGISYGKYRILEEDCFWTDEMFCEVNRKRPKEKKVASLERVFSTMADFRIVPNETTRDDRRFLIGGRGVDRLMSFPWQRDYSTESRRRDR